MTNFADIRTRDAWLSSEFGENMARRYFGDKAVDNMPRYVRGKRKGLLKGQIQWRKVERGGWVSDKSAINGRGYVENRLGKVIAADLVIPEWGAEPKVLLTWKLAQGAA